METRPFAGFNAHPQPWGYNWTTENISSTDYRNSPTQQNNSSQSSPISNRTASPPEMLASQYMNMPAALLTSLKKDKKPFTYTPGGVNLSEVLNARLQKRLERKKKYSEEQQTPIERLPKFGPPKQVVVMPTYNTPLDMYSMENAIEALEMQAELVVGNKSLSAPPRSATLPRNHTFKFDEKDFDSNKGVAQSKAFKVLQIITDTEEDFQEKDERNCHFQDEMRFTGIRDSKTIPSKFFQTLQKITGTDEEEIPSGMKRSETSRSAVFEKQPMRPGYQQIQLKQNDQSPTMQNEESNFQSTSSHHKMVHFHEPVTNSPLALKRPAAFLPMKTGVDPLTRVKPVHPAFLTNGIQKICNPSGGTNF